MSIPIDSHRLKKLLGELVDIYSPSGKEIQALQYAEQYLAGHGVGVRRQEVDQDRYNLVVGPEDDTAEVMFVGHIDTVPAYDLDDYGHEYGEDGVLRGLGVADMKGGCAAMIEAFVAFVEKHGHTPPVLMALVVGEEETGDGARELATTCRASWALVGEPTDLVPNLGHYGYVEIELTATGQRAHASLAKDVRGAVHTTLRVLQTLTHHLDRRHPEVVYNIRDVQSSRAGFAVPEQCRAAVDLHLPPESTVGDMLAEIEELLADQRQEGLRVEFMTVDGGYSLPDKGTLPELLHSTYERLEMPWRGGVFRSHSDANTLWAAGIRPVVLGPGQIAQAHTAGESIRFAQVEQVARVYYDLLEQTASSAKTPPDTARPEA
jgi:acetylornithine deacetylase